MKCPHCTQWSEVLETRTRPDGSKRRRYECANEHRFTTVERVIAERPTTNQDTYHADHHQVQVTRAD